MPRLDVVQGLLESLDPLGLVLGRPREHGVRVAVLDMHQHEGMSPPE